MDVPILHAVTEDLAGYLSEVTEGDLGFGTPCRGWTVGDLIAHLLHEVTVGTATLSGDLDASARVAAVLAGWECRPFTDGGGLEGPYRQATRTLRAAFAATTDPRQPLQVSGRAHQQGPTVLAEWLICDTVAHTWDLAQVLGMPYEPAHDVARSVLHALRTRADLLCCPRAQRTAFESVLERAVTGARHRSS